VGQRRELGRGSQEIRGLLILATGAEEQDRAIGEPPGDEEEQA